MILIDMVAHLGSEKKSSFLIVSPNGFVSACLLLFIFCKESKEFS